MRLLVKAEYKSAKRKWAPGDIVEVDKVEADFLMNDSPGTFKHVEAAPNKMVEGPPRSKSFYSAKTVADLRQLLDQRGLPKTGNKATLVRRLVEADKAAA